MSKMHQTGTKHAQKETLLMSNFTLCCLGLSFLTQSQPGLF